MEEKRTVAISSEVYARLTKLLEGSGAESEDELVSRILRDWLSKQSAGPAAKDSAALSKDDEKIVEERLKSLGYM